MAKLRQKCAPSVSTRVGLPYPQPFAPKPAPCASAPLAASWGRSLEPPMKTPPKPPTYAPPTPKVARMKKAKVLTPTEREAFLASRPDLKGD